MKSCPYCGNANNDQDIQCRKCDAYLTVRADRTVYKARMVGPLQARSLRGKALSFIVLGLLIKVYWGGYGPWPVYDAAPFPVLRDWLVPIFILGGAIVYAIGWVLNWI